RRYRLAEPDLVTWRIAERGGAVPAQIDQPRPLPPHHETDARHLVAVNRDRAGSVVVGELDAARPIRRVRLERSGDRLDRTARRPALVKPQIPFGVCRLIDAVMDLAEEADRRAHQDLGARPSVEGELVARVAGREISRLRQPGRDRTTTGARCTGYRCDRADLVLRPSVVRGRDHG